MAQPLDNFFLKTYHWNAAQVASFMAMLMVPWTVKPLFGFFSDGFPIFGSTTKNYLCIAFAIGGLGYFLASIASDRFLAPALILSSTGLACASAVSFGLAVKSFVEPILPYILSIQLFAYYLALMGSGVLAGWLCNQNTPQEALHASFRIAGAVCLLTAMITPFLVKENRSTEAQAHLLFPRVKQILSDKKFLLVAAFIFLWSFSPGFGTPLYFHYTNVLHLPQLKIGEANGYHAFGMLVGVICYSGLWRFAPRIQIQISIWLYVLTTLAFTFVAPDNVLALEFLKGVASILGSLSINAMAASVALPGIETLATAVLMSVYNLGTLTSGVAGAFLYTSAFHNNLPPLLAVSAISTACCSVLLRKYKAAS